MAAKAHEPGKKVAAVTPEILICSDGSNDAERAIDAAAIVIGSRGLGGLREFARGSVSRDVATHARRPALIMPPVTT